MVNDKLEQLNKYFQKYIEGMLIKDIELLKARNDELNFSYPYILLSCSCIDLFGGIEKGFSNNSEKRFMWFISECMGKINPLYKEESLSYLIYDSWRCGVMHQATLKRGFETSSYMHPREKHLHYIKDKGRVFVHSLQFADDLICAYKLFKQNINNRAGDIDYIELLYRHLLEMINEHKIKKEKAFARLIELLIGKNMIFSSKNISKTLIMSPQVSSVTSSTISSPTTITGLPDKEELSAIPSAEPDEDDLD